jgi:GDP-mannose 4,6-dehydratase
VIRRVLITGICGAGGSYLAEHIAAQHPEVEIHGTETTRGRYGRRNLATIIGRVVFHPCDLTDPESTVRAVDRSRPDVIFHLASRADVQASFREPVLVLSENIPGTQNLLEAVRHHHPEAMVQICSTSEVYGSVSVEENPITERQPLNPGNPYSLSKATQDMMGRIYHACYGLKVVTTRAFGYINPRRPDLCVSSFARQIVRIERGLQATLRHGNLSSVRSMSDVRDIAKAYWLAAERGEPGEVYNIGTTEGISIETLLSKLIERSSRPIPTEKDPALLRPVDHARVIPCIEKFVARTGWTPDYSLDRSLDDLMTFCRGEPSQAGSK